MHSLLFRKNNSYYSTYSKAAAFGYGYFVYIELVVVSTHRQMQSEQVYLFLQMDTGVDFMGPPDTYFNCIQSLTFKLCPWETLMCLLKCKNFNEVIADNCYAVKKWGQIWQGLRLVNCTTFEMCDPDISKSIKNSHVE